MIEGGIFLKVKRVLIAVKDRENVELLIEELSAVNCRKEIILKENGQEVADYFENIGSDGTVNADSQIDLLILCLNLPRVHCLDILKLLKKDPKHSSIPIIIFSTRIDSNTASEVYENGANSYITKPISFADFQKNIQIFRKYLLN
ncbi:MAG: response regulator [Candidatus Scalindua sp.]|jgi:DNA-binding response OmpR family regulator|nr:response regulator [Candidatus Scalindua sp.]MDV5166895.1 response regulator [Candidatus Scalindua sp.]